MNTHTFNEWEVYPFHLTAEEINKPLLVIADFFHDDWLPDQLERLKTWRNFVLTEAYYLDEKQSPVGLLLFYKLNVRLIEALYLFSGINKEPPVHSAGEPGPLEEGLWRDYPTNLSESELNDPNIVISNFFKAYTLQQYREHLYEWLEHGLSSKAAREFIATNDLVNVYENLQKLYSAAWVINQRLAEKPYLKNLFNPDRHGNQEKRDSVNLYQLNTAIPNSEQEKISKIVSIIKHKVPTTQAVICLGTIPDNAERIFLLVLTSREETQTAQSLNCLIEDSCRDFAKVTALVHFTTAMLTALGNNSRFFHQAIHCPIIYLSGDMVMPTPKPLERIAAKESESFKWESWLQQGKDFLAGADFYLRQETANAALFSLHQSAECILIALIRGVNGYGTTNHNLSRLITITEMFTGAIAEVFDKVDSNKAELFESLKQAYFNVRYKDGYMADIETAKQVYGTIQKLAKIAEQVYARHILVETL